MLLRLKLAGIITVILVILIPAVLIYASESSPPRPTKDEQAEEGNYQFQAASADTIDAVVIRSWSGCGSGSVIWDSLNSGWASYGSTPINIIYNYPGLCGSADTITYDKLIASGADVLIISDAAGGGNQYSSNEIAAIQRYVQAGHNLIGTYATFIWSGTDNSDLAPLFGIKAGTTFNGALTPSVVSTYSYNEPTNPLFKNIGPPYTGAGFTASQIPTSGTWTNSLLDGARIAGINGDQQAAILVYNHPDYHSIYISHLPEFGGGTQDHQFFYNAITFNVEIEALVLRSWSQCGSNSVIWDALNQEWPSHGSIPIYILYNYPGLCGGTDTITYDKLVASGADVLIISNAGLGGISFSDSEINAIQQYLDDGHNLIGTSVTFMYGLTNNSGLQPLFGIKASAVLGVQNPVVPNYFFNEPNHPLFRNISEPYASTGFAWSQVPEIGTWTNTDLDGGRIVGITSAEDTAIIVNFKPPYQTIFISNMPEYVSGAVDKQFFYNAIIQKVYPVYLPLVGHNICGGFPGSSEIEPNNSAGQANGLSCPGINYQGNPNNNANGASAKDDDWFKIFWDGSGTLTVDVTHYLADAQVLLYHESNTSTELTRDFQKPNGHYTVNYSGNKGAGIYYVRLFAPIGHPTNTGNYNLTVTDN